MLTNVLLNNTKIGALTSKPYSFKSRSWELENIRTIDLFDSLCSSIKIDIKGSEIIRISPVNNKYINDYWISDKTRYAYDGLKKKRFINPMRYQRGLFLECSWVVMREELEKLFCLNIIKKKYINYENFIIKTGHYTDLEHLVSLQKFVNSINGWINILINTEFKNSDLRQNYLLNYKNLFELKTASKKVFFFYRYKF